MNQGWPRGGGGPPKGEGDTFLNWGLGSPEPRVCWSAADSKIWPFTDYITARKSHITLHYSQKKSDYITLQARKVTLHYITGDRCN